MNFWITIHIFLEEANTIILDSKYAVCMFKNSKDINHTRYIARILHLVINGEKCKIHNIFWYEGSLQLSDIVTKNVGDNYLNPRMKYIMVSLDIWE